MFLTHSWCSITLDRHALGVLEPLHRYKYCKHWLFLRFDSLHCPLQVATNPLHECQFPSALVTGRITYAFSRPAALQQPAQPMQLCLAPGYTPRVPLCKPPGMPLKSGGVIGTTPTGLLNTGLRPVSPPPSKAA